MHIFKRIEFWISIAVVVGGILIFLNLPNRVKKNEEDIDKWREVSIRQEAITEILVENQSRLIDR